MLQVLGMTYQQGARGLHSRAGWGGFLNLRLGKNPPQHIVRRDPLLGELPTRSATETLTHNVSSVAASTQIRPLNLLVLLQEHWLG